MLIIQKLYFRIHASMSSKPKKAKRDTNLLNASVKNGFAPTAAYGKGN